MSALDEAINSAPSDPQGQMQGSLPDNQPVKDRAFFLSRGAIEKPLDGNNTKPTNGKCLTCIDQKASCHGSSIESGKCLSCQGFGVGPGATRPKRTCCWLEPERAIYTMKDAQRAYGLTTNDFNTREGLRQREVRRNLEALRTTAGSDDEEADPGLFDFDSEGPEYSEMRRLAVEMFKYNLSVTSPGDNLARMGMLARREIQVLMDDTSSETVGPTTTLANIQTVYTAIIAMSERGEGLKIEDLRYLLPKDHPLRLQSHQRGQ